MDYATANILTQNQSNKNLLLSIIDKLLESNEFEVTVKKQLRYFNKRLDRVMLFNFVKELVWDELYRKNLTQGMIISLYWYDEDFTEPLDAYINSLVIRAFCNHGILGNAYGYSIKQRFRVCGQLFKGS